MSLCPNLASTMNRDEILSRFTLTDEEVVRMEHGMCPKCGVYIVGQYDPYGNVSGRIKDCIKWDLLRNGIDPLSGHEGFCYFRGVRVRL